MDSDVEDGVEAVEVQSLVPELPQAEIRGIQFGLFSNADIVKLSVCERGHPFESTKQLADPKLGLPTAAGICATCNGGRLDMCQGHFAHCVLPQLIFHPSHVGKLVAVLRKVCLNCGQLKKKKKKKGEKLFSFKTPARQSAQTFPSDHNENGASTQSPTTRGVEVRDENQLKSTSKNKRKLAEIYADKEARGQNGVPTSSGKEPVILLSSDEDAALSDAIAGEDDEFEIGESSWAAGKRTTTNASHAMADEENPLEVHHSRAPVPPRRSTRKRKSTLEVDPTLPATVIDLTNVPQWESFTPTYTTGKRQRAETGKSTQSPAVTVAAIPRETNQARRTCKYCVSYQSAKYPEVLLKVEAGKNTKDEVLSKMIRMECKVKKKDMSNVAPDFWRFVEPSDGSRSDYPRLHRFLLPSEALKILMKIPQSAAAHLGMHPAVAWPESLIVESIPVPPNCTRILDEAFNITNLGLKLGTDRATLAFSKVMNKISTIKKSRFSKPRFNVAKQEAMELQSLFGMYLREKGAPKAVPGREKTKIDHVGRVEKRDSRWSLEWLKRHVLGKRGAYSARNVLTGDPFLKVEEIGIPQVVAKYVTIPERVNKLNKGRLQDCVDVGQTLVGRYRACGAVRIIRNGEGFAVTKGTNHEVQIGDIVDRHLKDGDLVYVNRPPSLHRHSLLGLKVHVQDMSVFTINPAVCAPLHADFDGDCLHVFVPQSEEARAELQQLMSLPEQILPTPTGKTIVGMSQDNILATYLMTASPVFLRKEDMHQLSMWSSKELPVPTIVKSPHGPLWAGKQVFDLTIPKDFSLQAKDGVARIEAGELISYGGTENWLTNTKGLLCKLSQYSPQAAVDHLDCVQSVMREWLLSRGFSLSLQDFYAAPDHKSRMIMIQNLKAKIRTAAELAIDKELLFDESYVKMDVGASDPNYTEALEDVSISYFQEQFAHIGEELGSGVCNSNQLLAMVRSGSKGSLSKVLHQIGCFGLQLQKGEHLVPCKGNSKLNSLAMSMQYEDKWECQGLVKSSLLDGLDPLEYFFHSIAVRAALLRQSLEVTEPGELFKNLMLFLRDLHVAYDGTVRNKCGSEIVQFSYDDAIGPDPEMAISGPREAVMPGDPVGILAATAIAQPAYQVMLEANHNVGSQKMRPLELLQSTLFPRKETKLKAGDRKSIIRLQPCSCCTSHCDERRALSIRNSLLPVSIKSVATAISIQYVEEGSLEWTEREEGLKLQSPWIGHVQLDEDWMLQNEVAMGDIEEAVSTAFSRKSHVNALSKGYLRKPIFFYRNVCDCMQGGPCLHFSASMRSKASNRKKADKKAFDFVSALRDVMMPLVLATTIKGDERVESAKITWEEAVWSPCVVSEDGELRPASGNGELVIEVLVQGKESMSRGTPWRVLKEISCNIRGIDWNRSAPYSIQELQHAFGVEAARDCILQRLTLATRAGGSSVQSNHLRLVADLMVRSGEVIGLTSSGYRDLMKSLKTSAPFTSGAFRAPIKTFLEAGEKGQEEVLNGVLASNIFGKRVPVGTGADFGLKLDPKMFPSCTEESQEPVDIFELLKDLRSKIKVEYPTPVEAPEEQISQDIGGACSADQGGGWGPNEDWGASEKAGAWGNNENAGEWGANENAGNWGAEGDNGDWGANENGGGWAAADGCVASDSHDNWDKTLEPAQANGGWGSSSPNWDGADEGKENESEAAPTDLPWGGSPSNEAEAGGWGGSPSKDTEAGGSGSSPPKDTEAAGWGTEAQYNGLEGELSVELPVENDADGTIQSKSGQANGWGLQPSWGAAASEERGQWEFKEKKPREFRPTGANMVPLGNARRFQWKIPEEGATGVSSASPQLNPANLDKESQPDEEIPDSEMGTEGETWGADPSVTPLEEETSGWGAPTLETEWTSTPVQEGVSEPKWGNTDDKSTKDVTKSYAPVQRALDSRKDSKAWEDIIEKVRAVRDILQHRLPGEELEDAGDQELLTEILSHHPSHEAKVGCGIKFFKVGTVMKAPNGRPTVCFYLVRNDNTQDDFSYHKCLHNMTKTMTPPLDDLYEAAFMKKRIANAVP